MAGKRKYKVIQDGPRTENIEDLLNEAHDEGYQLRFALPGFRVDKYEYAWPSFIMEYAGEKRT